VTLPRCRSRCLPFPLCLHVHVGLQRSAERRQVAISAHAAEPGFDVEERGGEPALLLVARLPVVDLRRALLDQRVDGLDAVRRREAEAELGVQPEPVESQRLLQAFVEARGRRGVELGEFRPDAPERRLRFLVGRVRVGLAELAADAGVLVRRQVRQDVLALVPLMPISA
jgi:hypothetical protein